MNAQKYPSSSKERLLIVLRHAKSAWNTDAQHDHDRPLAPRGERACITMGSFIKQRDIVPDMVISSTALRAVQTTDAVLRSATEAYATIHQQRHDSLYACRASTWLTHIQHTDDEVLKLMIVGHNPELETLVEGLASDPIAIPDNGKLMPTAALALFQHSGPWSDIALGRTSLVDIVLPRALQAQE